MELDKDIQNLLSIVEKGQHTIKETAERYLQSLPGYQNHFHRPITCVAYERYLLRDQHNFTDFMNKESVYLIDQITKDKLQFYKEFIANQIEPRTAAKYISVVRQLSKYAYKIGWLIEDIAIDLHLPKPAQKEKIDVIQPEVCDLILKGNWGLNDFTRKRNKLIVCLFLKRGLHPMEIPKIMLVHIEIYQDLHVINVEGKRGRWREVMLDPVTDQALREYAVERGKYLKWRGANDEHLVLASSPRFDGSYQMSTGGVSAIIQRIREELQGQGCLYSLKNVTPNLMRHTAETADYERVEHLPVKNPEMSVTAQFGNSPAVARRHYVRPSRRNAYMLIKGGFLMDGLRSGNLQNIEKLKDLQSNFLEADIFRRPFEDDGAGI